MVFPRPSIMVVLVVFPWPSMVVLPSWFLPGPPWWHSPRGFSLALHPRGFSLALVVVLLSWFLPVHGWPFLILGGCSSWSFLMVPPCLFFLVSPWPFLVAAPSGISLSRVPTFFFYLSLTFSVSLFVLPCCPVMLHMNYNSIVFETSAKVQNF